MDFQKILYDRLGLPAVYEATLGAQGVPVTPQLTDDGLDPTKDAYGHYESHSAFTAKIMVSQLDSIVNGARLIMDFGAVFEISGFRRVGLEWLVDLTVLTFVFNDNPVNRAFVKASSLILPLQRVASGAGEVDAVRAVATLEDFDDKDPYLRRDVDGDSGIWVDVYYQELSTLAPIVKPVRGDIVTLYGEDYKIVGVISLMMSGFWRCNLERAYA